MCCFRSVMLHSAFGVIGPTRAVSLLGRRFQRRAPTVGACRLHNNWFRSQRLPFPLTNQPPPPFPLPTSPRRWICGEDLQYDGDDDEKSASIGGTRNCVCATFVNVLSVTKKMRHDAWCRGSTVARKTDLVQFWPR